MTLLVLSSSTSVSACTRASGTIELTVWMTNHQNIKFCLTSNNIKQFQTISSTEDIEKGFILLKEKCLGEVEYFRKFKKSYWNGFRKNWLSAHLETSVPRASNSCEKYNRCFKEFFTFRKLSTPSEFLQNSKAWGESESHHHSNLCTAPPVDHVRFKTSRRSITSASNLCRKSQF